MKLEAGKRYVCENGWVTLVLYQPYDGILSAPIQVEGCREIQRITWDDSGKTLARDNSHWDIAREFRGEREEPEKTGFKPGPAQTRDGREAYIYWVGEEQMHVAVKEKTTWYVADRYENGRVMEGERMQADILPNAEPDSIDFEGDCSRSGTDAVWLPVIPSTPGDTREIHGFWERNKGKRLRTRIEVVE